MNPAGHASPDAAGTLSGTLPSWLAPQATDPALLGQLRNGNGRCRLVVLDDDPTGMQTLYGIPVVLQWQQGEIHAALQQDWPAVYILTNSRSMDAATAAATVRDVMRRLVTAAQELGLQLRVVSRSDSTLRGHYPLETDVMAEELSDVHPVAGTLLVPAFIEGGRVTHGGVHYLIENGTPVPVGQTEYARDPAFPYRASSLPDWVEEKTGGRVPAAQVPVLPLHLLREGGPTITDCP